MRYALVGICAVALLAAGFWLSPSGQQPALGADKDSEAVKTGEYLVTAFALCSDCHTPQDDKGQPNRKRMLQGVSSLPIKPKKEMKEKDWADMSPDITRSGLAGKWKEEDLVKFLTTGKDPDGKSARPPMPAFRMTPKDARAVALYLKSLPGKK